MTLTFIWLEDQGVVIMYTHITFGPIPSSRSGEISSRQTDKQKERVGVKQYLTKIVFRAVKIVYETIITQTRTDNHPKS